MKTSHRKIGCSSYVSILTGLICLYFTNCYIDHGLEPLFSKITGQIIYTGEAPSRTDEIRLAAARDFPPKDINELLFSEQIPYNQDTVSYELYLPQGKYEVVALIWKEKNRSWNISDLIGIYGGSFIGDQLIPTYQPITIADRYTVLEEIDIQANLNRVNRDASIEGEILFQGDWPENTGAIGVGAFTEIPEKGNALDYFFKGIDIDYSLPIFVNRTAYRLRVHATDTLKYIAVLWIDENYDLGELQDIGFYRDSLNPSSPGTVAIPEGLSRVENIDMVVDFSEMGEGT